MNEERAVAAQAAVLAFECAMKTDDGDLLTDLLCALLHLADRRPLADGWNFERALARARGHYCEETEAEDAPAVIADSATTTAGSCELCGAEPGKPHQDAALVQGGSKIQRLHKVRMNGGEKILCTLCRDGFADTKLYEAAGEPLSNMGRVHRHCLPPAPTAAELAAIYVGDFVKIIRGGERFWCVVVKPKGASVVGEISNDLVRTSVHGLKNGDILEFPLSDVIQIEKRKEQHVNQQQVN